MLTARPQRLQRPAAGPSGQTTATGPNDDLAAHQPGPLVRGLLAGGDPVRLSPEDQLRGEGRLNGVREERERILKLLDTIPGGRFIERAKLARIIQKGG